MGKSSRGRGVFGVLLIVVGLTILLERAFGDPLKRLGAALDSLVPSDIALLGMPAGVIVIGAALLMRGVLPCIIFRGLVLVALASEVFFASSLGFF